MLPVMDKFIKSVPLVVVVSLLVVLWQAGDDEYTNVVAASLCAAVVFMLTAVVYIVMNFFKLSLMPAGRYVAVMFAAGFLTFGVLYASLEYFYS